MVGVGTKGFIQIQFNQHNKIKSPPVESNFNHFRDLRTDVFKTGLFWPKPVFRCYFTIGFCKRHFFSVGCFDIQATYKPVFIFNRFFKATAFLKQPFFYQPVITKPGCKITTF